ncbi:hypothetical protein AB0J63_01930 [Streptosporangium canum]|uniref:hypothetical protein n=1 Tax=Streptosporangium canum TaxID=324952 RepID=UPI0034396FFC
MAFTAHRLDRQRGSLALEPESLGEGGQGVVTRVLGPEKLVYKEYMPHAGTVNDRALTDLVDFGQNLTPVDRHLLLKHCAWPVARVVGGDRVMGFLMPEVPAEFYGTIGGRSKLVELQYLLFKPNWAWQDLHQPDITGRAEIALLAARLIDLLHGHGFVLGDISFRNLLWRPAPPYKMFVLDCDGFRRHGGEPVLRQAHTPDWDDPYQPATGPDLDTDRYKLALLMGRILACNAQIRPGKELELLPGLEPQVATAIAELFARAGGPRGSRPIASEWAQAILGRRRIIVKRPPIRHVSEPAERVAIHLPGATRGQQPISTPAEQPSSQTPPSTPRMSIPMPPLRSVPSSSPSIPRQSLPVVLSPTGSDAQSHFMTLGERITTSDTFADQRQISPSAISNDQVTMLIDSLAAGGGRLPVAAAATLIQEPVERARLLMGAAKRLLNIDGYHVLTLKDGDQTVALNLQLLKEQFLDEEVDP